jgi:hypothetical protein
LDSAWWQYDAMDVAPCELTRAVTAAFLFDGDLIAV